MTCVSLRDFYSDYYDGALEGETRDAFEAHLRTCPSCASDYGDYRRLLDDIRSLSEPEPPENLHAVLMGKLREAHPAAGPDKRTAGPRIKFYRTAAAVSGWAAACFAALTLLVSGISGAADALGTRNTYNAESQAAGLSSPHGPADTGGGAAVNGESAPFMAAADTAVFNFRTEAAYTPSGAAAAQHAAAGTAGDPYEMLAAGYFEQYFYINLRVDDIAYAASVVDRLNGYNTSADLRYDPYSGQYGTYQRKIDVSAYANVKAELRKLGQVLSENEYVVKLADELYDLEARLAAKEQECKRLTALLEQSRTMDVLVAVERRLGEAETDRETLRGRISQIRALSAHPQIVVNLYEEPPEPVLLPEATFSARISQRFIQSLNGLIVLSQNFVVFISGALVPLALAAAFAGFIVWLVRRYKRKRETERGPRDE